MKIAGKYLLDQQLFYKLYCNSKLIFLCWNHAIKQLYCYSKKFYILQDHFSRLFPCPLCNILVLLKCLSVNQIGSLDYLKLNIGFWKVYFFEVKTSASEKVTPFDNMNFRKVQNFKRNVEVYILKHKFHELGVMFSINFIAVYLNNDKTLKKLELIENLE